MGQIKSPYTAAEDYIVVRDGPGAVMERNLRRALDAGEGRRRGSTAAKSAPELAQPATQRGLHSGSPSTARRSTTVSQR